MRDPARIPEMLELLGRLWERQPDLRLGQLVHNLAWFAADAKSLPEADKRRFTSFSVEDGKMIARMLAELEDRA